MVQFQSMRQILWCATLLIVISGSSLLSFGSNSIVETGNDILSMCKDPSATLEWKELAGDQSCLNYIMGVFDGYEVTSKGGICRPEGVTFGQVELVVLKYVKDHPEELHEPAAALVLLALKNAFPCSKGAK